MQKASSMALWLKFIIVVVTTALIVYFMPSRGRFPYSYDEGGSWHYADLLSKEKFNVMMTPDEEQHMRDSIRRNFEPYIDKDLDVKESVKKELLSQIEAYNRDALGADMPSIDASTLNLVITHLDSVYRHGVMDEKLYRYLKDSTHVVKVISGNASESVPINYIYSKSEAAGYVGDAIDDISINNKLNLSTIIRSDLQFDKSKSDQELFKLYDGIVPDHGFVEVNEKIVGRGEKITTEIFHKLESYKEIWNRKELDSGTHSLVLPGRIIAVLIALIALMSYLSIYRDDYLKSLRGTLLLFLLVSVFSVAASTMVSHQWYHVYMLPCCMVPIIITVFYDSRTAFIFHLGTTMLISLSLEKVSYEFMLLQIVAGLLAVLYLREMTRRAQLVHTAVMVVLIYVIFYCAYEFTLGAELKDLDRRVMIYFCVSGLFLLFVYPLLWIMEKAFGFTSDVTLVELSALSNPLLQKLSEVAPGTFQHSIQVSNLAAEVAKKIGAKSQLVRIGALYHDIGKMERPAFFTENQAGINPHKRLDAMRSADVIISHVTNGLMLAEKHNLPQMIRDFISTHHGLGVTKYFLVTYKNEHSGEQVDESPFRYPGPNPMTREQAILMMADSVEAASRSLNEYTDQTIGDLVDRIVDSQVKDGFFVKCPVTFKDISDAKDVFKERLKAVYHTRITYPELTSTAESRRK